MDQQAERQRFESAGQGQVFRFWEELEEPGRQRLRADTAEIDLEETGRLVAELLREGSTRGPSLEGLEPAPYLARPEHGAPVWDFPVPRAPFQ